MTKEIDWYGIFIFGWPIVCGLAALYFINKALK